VIVNNEMREMSFGAWDNWRVCGFAAADSCHLFYKNQHVLVKEAGINGNHEQQEGENFVGVLLRAYFVLQSINEKHAGKK
jgi:hypothetical protein